MEKLLATLKNIPEFRQLLACVSRRESAAVTGIGQINRSHMIAALCKETARPMVIICQDDIAAKRMQEELVATAYRLTGMENRVFAAIAEKYNIGFENLVMCFFLIRHSKSTPWII